MQDVCFTFPEAREPGGDESVYAVATEQPDQYFTPQARQCLLRETSVSDYGSVTF